MRRLLRDEGLGRICIPITETTMKDAIKAVKEADRFADLIELRMDYLREPGLAILLKGTQKPFIVTNRRKEEGGKYWVNERRRVGMLEEAMDLGVDFVDVEIRTERSLLQKLIANKKRTQVILSFHDFQGTPSLKELKRICDRMTRWGVDIVKIVTFARSWEDNLLMLSLIPYARKRGQEIVAFCMGEKGRMSRIFAPLMGAVWTYTALNKNRTSAPGQLTIQELKKIWEKLR
jgi:3-dehydroquinate dehydratase type I